METATLSEPIERRNRLAELGLDEEELQQCVARGQAAWADCTPNHPPLFRGVSAWAETTCGVREYLLPKGWKRVDDGNLPLTVNKSGNVAITVSTGDEDTGRVDGNPWTKSSKGPRTAEAVADNKLRYTLFGDIRKVTGKVGGRLTYILLFHRDVEAQEIRCELSSPVKINEDGRVDGWSERIILGSFPFGADRVSTPNVPQTPDFDVEVKRRSA